MVDYEGMPLFKCQTQEITHTKIFLFMLRPIYTQRAVQVLVRLVPDSNTDHGELMLNSY